MLNSILLFGVIMVYLPDFLNDKLHWKYKMRIKDFLFIFLGGILFMGVVSAYGQKKIHEGLDVRNYEWSMESFNFPRTPGGDSVYAVPYNEYWYYNVDTLIYYIATDLNNPYTQTLAHYHIWEIPFYASEKQLIDGFNRMKEAGKRYKYHSLDKQLEYTKIFLPLYISIARKNKITDSELDDIFARMEDYNRQYNKNDNQKTLNVLCDLYRLCRYSNNYERTFKYIPTILNLLEQVPIEKNPDYYYLYFFIGNDYYRFGDRKRGIQYLKKALHNKPTRFSDRSDLRARTNLAEYYAEINLPDSSDYYYRSLYDSRQIVRFRPVYDIVAAEGIAGNLVKRDKYDEALPILERWLPEARRLDTYKTLFGMYSSACRCYIAKEQYGQSKIMIDSLRSLITRINTGSVMLEITPENDLPTENLYELQSLYFAHIGKSAEAQQYLDSMRIERTRRKEKLTPLIILYAEHEAFENEKMEINKKEAIYAQYTRYLLSILGLVLVTLLIVLYFYKKNSKAYRELACKSKEWAKKDALDIVATDEESDLILQVHKLMNDGLFRDCGLSLESLAEKLSVNRNTLSRAINRVTGKRFNLFINEYRIKEAIRMIENIPCENKNLYIDGLYQELGFNSPASFFRVFKQITGLSPGLFYRQINNKSI